MTVRGPSRAPRPHRRKGRVAKEARQEGATVRESLYVKEIVDVVISDYGKVITEYADIDKMDAIREKLKGRNVKARRYLEDK